MLKIQISGDPEKTGNYEDAVREAGGQPVAGYCPEPDLSCDGLILAGGGDIEPGVYGQRVQGSQPPDTARDRAELTLFRMFYRANKPILGICRGHQLVNAATGGANMLNFPRKHAVEHSEGIAHDVLAEPGSFLARIYGERFLVNSFHRDCAWSVGPGMREAAKSPDGLIEAIEHRDLPVFGVQFHPERMRGDNRVPALGPDGTKLFEFFVNIC